MSDTAGDVDPGTPSARGRGRQIGAGLLTVAVLIVVFAGILPRFGSYAAAWGAISAMSVVQLGYLTTAVVVSIVVYVFPFQAALPGLRYGPAFMIRQSAFTISNAVPAGGAIGLGVQYGMLAQAGFSGASSTAAIGITSVFNLMVTLALPVLGVVALLFVQVPTASEVLGALAGLVAIALMAGLFAAVLRSDRSAERVGGWLDGAAAHISHLVKRDEPTGITDQIVDFRRSTVHVVEQRWPLITSTNFAQQFAQFGVLMVSLRITEAGEATAVTVAAAFAAFSLARLAAFIPITPGGLGTVDAGLTGLLVAFGATESDALAATLLWRAASWVPQVLLGVVTLLVWRFRMPKRRRRRVGGSPASSG